MLDLQTDLQMAPWSARPLEVKTEQQKAQRRWALSVRPVCSSLTVGLLVGQTAVQMAARKVVG
jgi:hypothetical protein